MKVENHDFFDFMHSVKTDMASEYERIQKHALEDPGTAGDEGEENWAELLRNWLPANYPVVTKGRLLDVNGKATPQLDILVLHPSYPRKLRNKKMYFAGGVVAVFECKLTLKKEHVKKALANAVLIKRALHKRTGTPFDELHQSPFYGLLAHSYSWKSPPFEVSQIITKHLNEFDENCKHPREMLDALCVANLGVYILKKVIYVKKFASDFLKNLIGTRPLKTKNGLLIITDYQQTFEFESEENSSKGEILGTLILEITKRMAYEDSNLRSFAQYLEGTGIWWGIGQNVVWEGNILSNEVACRLIENGCVDELWSKWAESF